MSLTNPFESKVYEEIERIMANPPENKLIHSFYVARELLEDPSVFDRSKMDYLLMDHVYFNVIPVFAVKDMVKEIDVQYLDIEVKRKGGQDDVKDSKDNSSKDSKKSSGG